MKKKKISAPARAAGFARWRDPSKSRFARYHRLLVRARRLLIELVEHADHQKVTSENVDRIGWRQVEERRAAEKAQAIKNYARSVRLAAAIRRELGL